MTTKFKSGDVVKVLSKSYGGDEALDLSRWFIPYGIIFRYRNLSYQNICVVDSIINILRNINYLNRTEMPTIKHLIVSPKLESQSGDFFLDEDLRLSNYTEMYLATYKYLQNMDFMESWE